MAIVIKPQPGPQEEFLSNGSDIVFYGGAAGGGKTFSLLMEPLHFKNHPGYNATVFRRTAPQIMRSGGLWDEAVKLYKPLGASMVKNPQPQARFKDSRVDFMHLQYDDDVYSWQGSQLCAILFDELTHFSWSQFNYMLSRNRSVCGIRPYVRGSCNPDPDHWLADFIDWYIDQDTGYIISERSGRTRFFIRVGDEIVWSGRRRDLRKHIELTDDDRDNNIDPDSLIKSFAFISSSIYDNKILLRDDPGYLASLKAMGEVEREQLLYGNWKIKRSRGNFFRRHWFTILEKKPPAHMVKQAIRGWDRAATEKTEGNNPDWTVGVLILKTIDDEYIVADVARFRERPAARNRYIIQAAQHDKELYPFARNIIEQDPGQAGIEEADSLVKEMTNANLLVDKVRVSTKKHTRALPFSGACENGLVCLVRGHWVEPYLTELESFSDNPKEYSHDDQVDASSVAFNQMNSGTGSYSLEAINSF